MSDRLVLPPPCDAVAAALGVLPAAPGVYLMRDASGRVVYLGRSGNLRARVRSYWRDLRDRPHLARMLAQVATVEPVVCASEHEAAFLERNLLQRGRPRFNRTTGVETATHLRLVSDAAAPSLEVTFDVVAARATTHFGPYLGWEPTRRAAAALNRILPVYYATTSLTRSHRELAQSRGIVPEDRKRLVKAITATLGRDPRAIANVVSRLAVLRDAAAESLQFEVAADLQGQIEGLQWITQTQKALSDDGFDLDVWGAADSTLVTLEVRGGRLLDLRVVPVPAGDDLWRGVVARYRRRRPKGRVLLTESLGVAVGAGREGELDLATNAVDNQWTAMADTNAELRARLALVGAVGPGRAG